jgi:HEAT repeat protein
MLVAKVGDAAGRWEDPRAALIAMGKDAVPVLEEELSKRDDVEIVGILEKIGEPAAVALGRALEDRKPEFRLAVIRSLGSMGPKARSAVPALAEALDPSSPVTAHAAIRALGSIGGPEAVDVLAARLDTLWEKGGSSGHWLLTEAAKSLGKAKDSSALPALVKLLRRKEFFGEREVAEALSAYGEEALRFLLPMLGDADVYIRRRAPAAIGRLGRRARRAVEPLRAALKDADWSVRTAAAGALGSIGPDAAPAVEDLIAVTGDGNAAVQALGEIGPAAKAAVPVLIRIAKDKKRNLADRGLAAVSLGRIGADAEPAIPALEDMMKEFPAPNSGMREDAERAIRRIREARGKTGNPLP